MDLTSTENVKIMNDPKVSILIPSKNRKKMLRNALKSAIGQTYTNLEIIVQDNNSMDGTYEYIKDLLDDPRVKYFKSDVDLSMLDNWSTGFLQVSGSLFVRLDDDNVFIPDFVERCTQNIKHYDLDAMTFSAVVLSKDGPFKLFQENECVYLLDHELSLLTDFYCLTDSNYTMYRMDLIHEIVGTSPFYETSLPDRFFNYRLAEANVNGVYRCGFSTVVKGVTRYDYKPHNKRKFFVAYYDDFFNRDFTEKLTDCQFNFQMHRAHCAYRFLEQSKNLSVKHFFNERLLNEKLLRSYSMFGHINQWQRLDSVKELLFSYAMFIHTSICFLKHPFSKIHDRLAVNYYFVELYRFFQLNCRTLEYLFFKNRSEVYLDVAHVVESGDRFCEGFLENHKEILPNITSSCGEFESYVSGRVSGVYPRSL